MDVNIAAHALLELVVSSILAGGINVDHCHLRQVELVDDIPVLLTDVADAEKLRLRVAPEEEVADAPTSAVADLPLGTWQFSISQKTPMGDSPLSSFFPSFCMSVLQARYPSRRKLQEIQRTRTWKTKIRGTERLVY